MKVGFLTWTDSFFVNQALPREARRQGYLREIPFVGGETSLEWSRTGLHFKWWDWLPDEMVKQLPWVIVGPETSDRHLARFRRFPHFGWTLANDQKTDTGIQSGMKRRTRTALMNSARAIAEEAWSMRRLPAVPVKDEDQFQIFIDTMKSILATLVEGDTFDSIKWSESQD